MSSFMRAGVCLLAGLLLCSDLAHAQGAPPTEPGPRTFVIANVIVRAPNEGTFTSAARLTSPPYTGYSFAYKVPLLAGGDIGGGVLVTPSVGFGVDVSRNW